MSFFYHYLLIMGDEIYRNEIFKIKSIYTQESYKMTAHQVCTG